MDQSSQWRWKSSMSSTPGTLSDFLNMYDRVPKSRLRVFFATSLEFINEMLVRENSGLVSNSITVEEFLKSGRRIDGQYIRELEFELGLQENRALIARSVITRKLGDERSSVQTASAFLKLQILPLQKREGSNRESNLMRQMPRGFRMEYRW